MQITFDRRKVTECLQQKFVLPTYQRDYKWEKKHLQELLADIQEAFLATWKPAHGRDDVLGYPPYFLGTIITTQVEQGAKAIVDGQQRITTLALILTFVHRASKQNPDTSISPVDQLIRRKVAGRSQFNLDMDDTRRKLFELLVDGPADEDDLEAAVESIPNIDPGSKQLWVLFQCISTLISSEITTNQLLPSFFDYLTECVYLFEIGVPREQDGHKVFVTMNDRGLKLGPIDLLKGFLLSSISGNEANRAAHGIWNTSLNQLRELGSDEDSNFFKTWLRAKYSRSIRGKNRGDTPKDFELIGDSYHRWVMENKEIVGLRNSDDFTNFLKDQLRFYVDIYIRVKQFEREFDPAYPHVYYNGKRDLTMQSMVALSAISSTDVAADVEKKLRAVSYYLDYLATVRYLNGKENTYDNVRDIMFELALKVRNLSTEKLRALLTSLIDSERDSLDSLKNCSYESLKRQDLLHFLARVADYLEARVEVSTKVGFKNYADRALESRTMDIEHLLASDMGKVNADLATGSRSTFISTLVFNEKRHSLGGLILLPRGRNRSMKDMSYSEKLARYSGENVLAQTLTRNFYLNQPNWTKFALETGIDCSAIEHADSEAIDRRTELYLTIARKVWNREELELHFEDVS